MGGEEGGLSLNMEKINGCPSFAEAKRNVEMVGPYLLEDLLLASLGVEEAGARASLS